MANHDVVPQTLLEKLKNGEVVPFVGAGVSMAVRSKANGEGLFPGWGQLLSVGIDKLEGDGKVNTAKPARASLSAGDYLLAADWLEKGLQGQLKNVVKQLIDKSRDEIQEESLALAQSIWKLGSPLVVTTNYDHVMEWASPSGLDCKTVINRQAFELNEIVRGKHKQAVWHLHGDVNDADSIVLTSASYARLYPGGQEEREWRAALETFRGIVARKSLVFIGYGLGDVQIIEQLRDIAKLFDGAPGPHFVLATEDVKWKIIAKNLPVEVICFNEKGEPLLELLHAMEPRRNASPISPTSVTSSTGPVADFNPQNSAFNVRFRPKGDQVKGRDSQLKAVRSQLTEGRRTAIGQTAAFHGVGGLGKTQLAVEYAYEFRDEYAGGVIWLEADSDIDAQLIELAEKSRWVSPQSEHKAKLDIALRRIRSSSDVLLIFDNVEERTAIEPYLPELAANPHILLTSRTTHFGFTTVDLDLLEPDVAYELLTQEANRIPKDEDEEIAAREIVKVMGGLPLAIELAGAFIQYYDLNWAQYLDVLQEDLSQALPQGFSSFTHHEADLFRTLHVDDKILNELPILREVLDVLTWSGSAPMGKELLAQSLNRQPAELVVALSKGTTLRLLQQSADGERYSIHRLVQQVRKKEVPLDSRVPWSDAIADRIGKWFQVKRLEFNFLPVYEREIDHLAAWQRHAETHNPEHAVRLLWLQAYPNFHRGNYKDSKALVERALEEYHTSKVENPELYAHLLNDLAALESTFSQAMVARKYNEESLGIRRDVLGNRHPDTAMSLNNLATTYSDLRQPGKALELELEALAIRRDVLGNRHPDTALSLNNLASTYRDFRQPEKALELELEALAILRDVLGNRHPDTATSLNNLATTYGDLRQPEKALELQLEALSIRREVLGNRHPDTATSLNNLASTYSDLRQPEKALELELEALAILRDVLGNRHPDTAKSLNNLASTYRDFRQPEKALELNLEALSIRRDVLGNLHRDTALSLNNLATTYSDLRQPGKALELELEALAIRRDVLGNRHPDTALSLNNLASTYRDFRQPEKALELELEALAILRDVLGNRHPDTATSLNNMASTYRDLRQPEKALELNLEALSIRQEVFGDRHPNTINSLKRVCFGLGHSGESRRAFQLLDKALMDLPRDHEKFNELEEMAINLLKESRGARGGFNAVTQQKKSMWRNKR